MEIGIHRKTVRQYLKMSEEEFQQWIVQTKHQPKKLNEYYEFVHSLLQAHPYLSAAQIEDRLKENYTDLPIVHSKTVYNFTESIRNRYGLKKQAEQQPRKYQKLPESEYGQFAQADFGEFYMSTQGVGRKKVHFFVMVLCRSRQKFVHFQSTAFTSASTVMAHQLAFNYFEGQPRKIIYDQDRVLITDENLGDILLTQEFKSYCNEMDFQAIFCRKSDPESKGKVENAVKYVKQNFLRGRTYIGDDELNKSVHGWLLRTGNGKEHAGIKKVPMQEWSIERDYLLPQKATPISFSQNTMPQYKVRKDNTVSYKSNFYTLPLGTYQDQNTWVKLKDEQDQVRIYDMNNNLLTIHPLSFERGVTIRNTDHNRDKSQSIEQLKEDVLQLFTIKEKGLIYLELLAQDKPRYLRDNLLALKNKLSEFDSVIIIQSLHFCLENTVYNANSFIKIAKYYQQEQHIKETIKAIIPQINIKQQNNDLEIAPQQSKLSTYEEILK